MAFISKLDPTILNIKLTNEGRELLSTGNLTFSKFAVGDSEVDYNFIQYVTGNSNFYVLKPKDYNPNILSYVVKNDTGTTKYNISTINNNDLLITNTVNNYGLFNITGGSQYEILSNIKYVRNSNCSVSLNTLQGTRHLNIKQTTPIVGNSAEPEIGDIVMLKLTNPNSVDTNNLTVSRDENLPILFYKITSIISGSFLTNNLIVEVDRNLPNYSTYIGSLKCRIIIYLNNINTDYATDYINDNVFAFIENYNIPTEEVRHWNLSIVHPKEIEGVGTLSKKFTSFNSIQYAGFASYIKNQNNVDRLGIIHYSNESPANTYGESLFENTAKLYIPTIMWHKNSNKTNGIVLTTSGGSPFILSGLSTTYYNLYDENNNIVGKAFNKLKIFTIEDQELLYAMSYKSNRNWTLPNYTLDLGVSSCGGECTECLLDATLTSPNLGTILINNVITSDGTNGKVFVEVKNGNTTVYITQFTGTSHTITGLNSGNYTVTLYDLSSPLCTFSENISVINVTCGISANITTGIPGQVIINNVTLSNSGSTNYATINLINSNNVIVGTKIHSGSTTTFNNYVGGNYTVSVIDPDIDNCVYEESVTIQSILGFVPTAFNIGEE